MHVLVTRPEPGAARTAERLRERGHQPLIIPLTQTVPIPENRALLHDVRAGSFVLTSAAALRHWPASELTEQQKSIPVYVVGETTGKEARTARFTDIRSGRSDGGSLAKIILDDVASGRLKVTPSRPVVYVAGRERRSELEMAIDAENLPFRTIEIYDTQEISYSTDYVLEQISTRIPIAIPLYSKEGACLLIKHLCKHPSDNILNNCSFLCLSQQIATALPSGLKAQTRIAPSPTETELLGLLDQLGTDS